MHDFRYTSNFKFQQESQVVKPVFDDFFKHNLHFIVTNVVFQLHPLTASMITKCTYKFFSVYSIEYA